MAVVVETGDWRDKREWYTHEVWLVRAVRPILRALADLTISVIPRGKEHEQFSRKLTQWDVLVDVSVQKKYDDESNIELDPLLQLAEEIADFFKERKALSTGATCADIDHNPIFYPPHMEKFRIFTSVITLTFQKRE